MIQEAQSSVRLLGTQVTNAGNVGLTDAKIASTDVSLDCDDLGDLTAGEIFTCSGTRTIFWPDVTSGWSNSTIK